MGFLASAVVCVREREGILGRIYCPVVERCLLDYSVRVCDEEGTMCYDGSGSSRKQGPTNAYQSQSQMSRMKEAFDLLDRDGDGNIKAEDLSAFLEDSLKRPLSSEDIHRMIDLADADGNGGVDFEEFLSLIQSQAPEKPECFATLGRDALGDMFRVLDRNGDGFLCVGDLNGVMGSLGQSLSSDELMTMVETATGSGQKEVCFEDFVHLMSSMAS